MGDILIGGLIAVVTLLAASLLTYVTDRSRWWREEGGIAGAMVAEIYDLIWGDRPSRELEIHLMKLSSRLQALGVPDSHIVRLDVTARACWSNARASAEDALETGIDELRGIRLTELNAFKAAASAVYAWLRPRSTLMFPPAWLRRLGDPARRD